MWDKFSQGEMERRWTLARRLMERRELDGLLIFGNSGVNRHNEANVFWLTNHLDLHHNYLLAPLDDSVEPALYTGLANHVPHARQVSAVPVVEWGGYDPAATVAGRLKATGLSAGRLGLVGVNATFSMGMPYQHFARLQELLPELEMRDATAEFARLRWVKSKEEIEWLRRAAGYTDKTIETMQRDVRPGMAEYELLGLIEGSYRSEGGLPHIAFLRSMPMDKPNGCVPAQDPSRRKIERGDVIITEISASHWGYSGQIHRPLFVGAEPTEKWKRLFDTALDAYRAIGVAIRPGATEADAIRAAAVIGERGYQIYDDLIHGYGVDIHPPLIDRSCCQYWGAGNDGQIPAGRTFEDQMAIVIQPNPITPDEQMGLQLGALTIVTESGAQSLHQAPWEPLIVDV